MGCARIMMDGCKWGWMAWMMGGAMYSARTVVWETVMGCYCNVSGEMPYSAMRRSTSFFNSGM